MSLSWRLSTPHLDSQSPANWPHSRAICINTIMHLSSVILFSGVASAVSLGCAGDDPWSSDSNQNFESRSHELSDDALDSLLADDELGAAAHAPVASVAGGYDDARASERASAEQRHCRRRVRRLRRIIGDQDYELAEAPYVRPSLFVLGQALAFDKELSGNRNISCMSCHHPTLATMDDRHLPLGQGGIGLGIDRRGGDVIPRNAPALFNMAAHKTMFWDSRVALNDRGQLVTPAGAELTPEMQETFEFGVVSAQAMFPVTSNEEMAGHPGDNEIADAASVTQVWERLMLRLGQIPTYRYLFENAYPGTSFDDMTFAHAANAIAGFEVAAFTLTESPWDRFVRGDNDALTHAEVRGALAFFDAGCNNCHGGAMFSDFEHHNTGQPQFGPGKGAGQGGFDDFGRAGVTHDSDDLYRFRTPSLRNVELTAPYGHTGAMRSLEAFVGHYSYPETSLREYDIVAQVNERHLWSTQVDNVEAVLERLDPAVLELRRIRPRRIASFLRTLTADDADALDEFVPPLVPSGLPVAD
ncbi:MAG: cytochrome-c peroxidase [Myxococcales bacterium FL481]|nr:MAG: cytochrome-c peroxidase [Myxococcales bacterium FL481]